MSEPKRYERCYHKDYIPEGMEEHHNGKWVSYADYARLKADVARLKNNCDYLDRKLDEEIARAASFAGEIANLRKLGTAMGKYLPDTDEANRAYIDFEAGGRS